MGAISHRQGNVGKISLVATVRNFALSRFGDSPGGAEISTPFGTIFGSEGAANLRPLKGERNFVLPVSNFTHPLGAGQKED